MVSELTNLEQAAIVLLSIDKKTAADIMSQMPRDEVEKVSIAMYNLRNINLLAKKEVINNFVNKVSCVDDLLGNKILITNILSALLSEEEAKQIVAKLKADNDVWSALNSMNPEAVALYLGKEKTHTAALVLSKIQHNKVAQILGFMDENKATDIINTLVSLEEVNPVVMKEISLVIKADLIDSINSNVNSVDTIKMLASVIGSMKKEKREKYISSLQEKHPEIVGKVQSLMFTFSDLVKIDPLSIPIIVQNIDLNTLILALKNAPSTIKSLFISNMPKKMAKIMEMDWEVLGQVKRSEVLHAQSEIMSSVRKMLDEGKIFEIEDE
jgi:flagellar motor switch protein FliG